MFTDSDRKVVENVFNWSTKIGQATLGKIPKGIMFIIKIIIIFLALIGTVIGGLLIRASEIKKRQENQEKEAEPTFV
jgi:hypothetical protein